MSSEREAVERLEKMADYFISQTDPLNEHAADLRLILTDYARLQSESAKDGEIVAAGWAMVEHFERVDGDERHKAVISRMVAALARKATPPADENGAE